MPKLEIYNTLTKEKEEFKPIKKKTVGMYNCGPTVYLYAHLGNLRAYVFADILKRTLQYDGYKVKQVINITDVGHLTSNADSGVDKVEKEAAKENKTVKEITEFYAQAFFDDLKKLNIETEGTIFPKASEHIKEQIDLIKILEKKGFTYKTSDGIYFDTSKFPDYGKLGGINLKGLEEGARIGVNKEKKNPTDFALWKFSPAVGEFGKRQQEWDSPWGVGFPGWHIECSAMSMKYLGKTFDLHTGGIDHIPVHHNNEIAQSESATEKKFVNYWMHSAFLNVSGEEKMAKSEGNFLRLQTLEEKGFNPLAYRYFLLGAHYRSPITFNFESIWSSQKALEKIVYFVAENYRKSGKIAEEYKNKFEEAVNDDLDTPATLALLWTLLKDEKISADDKTATILKFDKVLGLNIKNLAEKFSNQSQEVPREILALAEEREKERKNKNWEKADELRKKIFELGFELEDTSTGPKISPTKKL